MIIVFINPPWTKHYKYVRDISHNTKHYKSAH